MKRLTVTPVQKCNMIGTKLRQFRTEQKLSLELYCLSKVLHKPIEDFFEDYPSF